MDNHNITITANNAEDEELIELTVPYSPDLVERCRKIPTRKWDADKRVNMVHINDLPLLKDIFHDYTLIIHNAVIDRYNQRKHKQEDILALKECQDTQIDIPNTNISTAYNYQKVGIKFLQAVPRCLLADEMGCVGGDMVLNVNRAGNGRQYKLREIYAKFNGLGTGRKWSQDIPTKTISLCDGELRLNTIKKVLFKGQKETIKITFKSGKFIVLTCDHELLTENNEWVEATHVRAGDKLLTNGELELTNCSGHHKTHHRHLNIKKSRHGFSFIPIADEVVSTDNNGATDVYDVIMDDPHRNFVANKVIVHNCGKTLTVLATLQHFVNTGVVKKILIICPTSLKVNWQREARKWVSIRPVAVSGDFEERKRIYSLNPDAMIIGFHTLTSAIRVKQYDANGFPILKDGKKVVKVIYRDFPLIAEWKPDAIVVDECARMAEWKNTSSKLLSSLLTKSRAKCLYLLSGTPFENMRNLYGMILLINKNIFGTFKKFQEAFCEVGGYTGFQIVGRKNMGLLQERIAPVMLRRLKRDVLKELPEKIYQQYDIEMSDEQERAYTDLEVTLEADIGDKTVMMPWVFQRIVAFKHLCDAPQILNPKLTENPKMDELKKIVKELSPEHKIVIFSQFKGVTDIIVNELQEYNPAYLHGQIKEAERRQGLVDYFQENEGCRLFVSTLQAGGVGINLTASDVVIFYDKWWSLKMNSQAENRVHRIGQKNAPLIISLVMKDTIEERVEELIRTKQGFVDEVFNEATSDEDISNKLTTSQLLKLVRRKRDENNT